MPLLVIVEPEYRLGIAKDEVVTRPCLVNVWLGLRSRMNWNLYVVLAIDCRLKKMEDELIFQSDKFNTQPDRTEMRLVLQLMVDADMRA